MQYILSILTLFKKKTQKICKVFHFYRKNNTVHLHIQKRKQKRTNIHMQNKKDMSTLGVFNINMLL